MRFSTKAFADFKIDEIILGSIIGTLLPFWDKDVYWRDGLSSIMTIGCLLTLGVLFSLLASAIAHRHGWLAATSTSLIVALCALYGSYIAITFSPAKLQAPLIVLGLFLLSLVLPWVKAMAHKIQGVSTK